MALALERARDALGHGLGEGVDVGPAEGLGAEASLVDETLLDRLAAGGVRGGGDGVGTLLAVHDLGAPEMA